MNQTEIVLNNLRSLEESERLVCTLVLGLCSALQQGSLTPSEGFQCFFNPYTMDTLRRFGIRNKVIRLIHAGSELDDIKDLIPPHLPEVIEQLMQEARDYMQSLPPTRDPAPRWITVREEDPVAWENKKQALLQELAALSPLPNDDVYDQMPVAEQAELYNRYRRLLAELHPFFDQTCLEPLLRLFAYGDSWDGLSWTVVHSIQERLTGWMSQGHVEQKLRRAFETGSPGTQRWVIVLMGLLEPREYVDDFLQALRDPMDKVRTNAVFAFQRLRDPRFLPHLEAIRNDPSERVRRAVEEAVQVLRQEALEASSER